MLHQAYDVVLIGDSLTQGWPGDALAAAFPGKRVLNLGVNSDKTQNVIWRLDQVRDVRFRPQLVVLLIGTNNLSEGDAPCGISKGIEAIIGQIDRLWRDADLLIVDVPPKGRDFELQGNARRVLNGYIADIARARPRTSTLNIDAAMTCGWQSGCGNYRDDGIHFAPAGYHAFARRLRDAGMVKNVTGG